MALLECSSCRLPLTEGDGFCGNCGTPARPAEDYTTVRPDTGTWPGTREGTHAQPDGTRAQHRETGTAFSDRFFQHSSRRSNNPLTNATRYLCAAAYLNPLFANAVIWELLASRRAVAPSIGIDLGPVIRHCLNARRLQFIRDVILAILLVIGIFLATLPTIIILIIGAALTFLPGGTERRSLGTKLLAGAVVTIMVAVIGSVIGIIVVLSLVSQNSVPVGPLATATVPLAISTVAFALLTGTTVFVYTHARYRILGERLRPGAEPFHFEASTPRIESRIAEVEAAQWGNVALYAGQNPFVGAGENTRTWSIAIELDRAQPPGRDNWMQPKSRGYAPIDPVELHDEIRKRLLKLKDPELPPNERISALVVEDHIVGEGQRRWDGPLVDPARNVPYSEATEKAVKALICHPQAGLRYYQRVSVNDEGQAVFTEGQQVLSGADQEIAVSAFVYVAVEGRMFYLEFVSTQLPPVQHRYHVINLLTRMSAGKYLTLVILDAARSFFSYLIKSPVKLIGTLYLMHRERKAAEEEITSITDYLQDNVGARFSVREFGSSRSMHTHIQDLDALKYTKIIERLLTDTVLDFLVSKNVDVTAYRASVSVAINNGTVVSDSTVTGGTITGGQGSNTTINQPQAGSPSAAG